MTSHRRDAPMLARVASAALTFSPVNVLASVSPGVDGSTTLVVVAAVGVAVAASSKTANGGDTVPCSTAANA